MQVLQYLINGLSIGAVYAIIALGYTMVYGIAKMLNFAHGDVIMVGAYISFCVTNYLGLPAIVSVVASMAVCTLLGIVITLLQLAFQPIMYRLGQPLDVVEMALPYYRYMAWGTIPVMLYAAFKQFLEGVGNTTTAMVIVIICNSLNIGMNWLFIYGNLGAPEMGAAGAGMATLLSRVLMPILMIGYFVLSHSVRP